MHLSSAVPNTIDYQRRSDEIIAAGQCQCTDDEICEAHAELAANWCECGIEFQPYLTVKGAEVWACPVCNADIIADGGRHQQVTP